MTEMVYTVDEAAEILRCAPNYVRKLIKWTYKNKKSYIGGVPGEV